MKWLTYVSVTILVATCYAAPPPVQPKIDMLEMYEILSNYSEEASVLCNINSKARWASQTNIGVLELEQEAARTNLAYAEYRQAKHAEFFKDATIEDYEDVEIQRLLKDLKDLGTAALSPEEYGELNQATTRMSNVYNLARICPYQQPDCNLPVDGFTLDPHLENLMRDTTDYDELQYYWSEWREQSGKNMRTDYQIYVDLMNRAALANGYGNAGEMWRAKYDDVNFVENIDKLWDKVEPLYDALHTYVRHKFTEQYADRLDPNSKLLPAHLFGNMWAQSWVSLFESTKPFPEGSLVDVTQKMVDLNWNALQMFEESDNFYMSMGLPSSNMSFLGESMIEKPADRNVACHASAWDFCDGEDFRIKMCTKVDMDDFITVHHEMGHIMYYQMYKDLHLPFRTGATPAFHEAIGDTIALSVATPQHLLKINLLDSYADSDADNINALYLMALERVAFLPFGMLIDKWRWDVFSEAVAEPQWNSKWWEYRERYQKLESPVLRTESDFDPGAKYHVPANSQYIAYFVAHILEFEFYRSLCIEANEYDPTNPGAKPLHKCDFYESEAAGEKLRAGLELGASEPWTVALKALTGDTEITGNAILEYFKPLYDFLVVENQKVEEENVKEILKTYNAEATNQCNVLVKASWDVATDTLNLEKQATLAQAVVNNAKFVKDNYEAHFKALQPEQFTDVSVQRQVMFLSKLGTDILEEADLLELSRVIGEMSMEYNNAKICPFANRTCDVNVDETVLTLDPEITEVMARSTDYDELEYVWQEWHEKSGRGMRQNYQTYVDLLNKAAIANEYTDNGAMWRASYEDDNLINNIQEMWEEVEDLYNQLHIYVNKKLKLIYGDKMDQDSDLIPAHLLGNMWGQSWTNLYDRVKPFDNGTLIDVTQKMSELGISVLDMFEMSDDFIMNLGMASNAMSYNESLGAVITKPEDRVITCHASAWDFCDGDDFRIKMCTSINMEDFVTVHHEMGHIQYYLQYAHQDYTFRGGANPAFHEAVGDLFALSVSTPKHLEKIGFLTDYVDNYETNINALFLMALERVAFLPFGLLIDKWRWDVFNGTVLEVDWNKHWWAMREQYQKISAPVERSEIDFDAGAKFHVPSDYQYIAYFIAHILEFQLHRAMCLEAGEYEPNNPALPLHNCDISDSTAAGDKLKAGLSAGSSLHWSEALQLMTGETSVSGSALVEYFKPLYDFLLAENGNQPTDVPTDPPTTTLATEETTTTVTEEMTTTTPPKEDEVPEEGDNTVGIVVGSVVGVGLVGALAGYGIYHLKFR